MKIPPVKQAVLFYWSWFSGDGANELRGEHIALIQLPVGVCLGVSNGCQSPVCSIILHEILCLLLTDTFYMRYLKQTKNLGLFTQKEKLLQVTCSNLTALE